MPKKWKKALVKRLYNLTSSVRALDLIVEDEDRFEWKPGQFVTLDLPIGEKRLDRWRSYSIANNSNPHNLVQLAVSYIEGGKASEYFFNELKEGEILQLKGPDGIFCLPQDIDHKMVMICTGTGVVPFRSMLEHIETNNINHRGIHLIFGTRIEEGILYRQFFEKLADKMDNFEYTIALSRQEWEGYKGYVHEKYKSRYNKTDENIKFYLCGWQHVIDEAKSNLQEMGFEDKQIIMELYG